MKEYVKYKEMHIIWELKRCKDGTFDISVDDIQADTTYCNVDLKDLIFVSEYEYQKECERMRLLKNSI